MSDTPFGDADHPRPAPIHPDAVLPPPMSSQSADNDPTEPSMKLGPTSLRSFET
ncbi:chromosomal replication initiator protein DnaA [Cutibacterium acnes JCM 18920]|nr:chromosomal replication initiator protein DnaA [Cutibacterium acnes JCM 18920]